MILPFLENISMLLGYVTRFTEINDAFHEFAPIP
jgi:hypothetical protein